MDRIKVFILLLFMVLFEPIHSQNFVWQHTKGPMGGMVGDMAFDNNNNLIVGVYSWISSSLSAYKYYSGIYRTTDNGNSWNEIRTQFEPFEVYALYRSKRGHIFVGTKYQGRIYRSTDNGITWINNSSGYTSGRCMAFGESKDGVLFAGDASGAAYKSTNNGDSWQFMQNLYSFAFATDSNNTIWCASLIGLFKSTDNGSSWLLEPLFSAVQVSTVIVDTQGRIFVGTGYYNISAGVFYSSNGGNSWNSIGLDGTSILSLAINKNGRLFVGTRSNGLYSTTDLGSNWTLHNKGIRGVQVFRLKINSQNHIFIGSENEGVYRSTDGGESFQQIGLPISHIQNIDFSPDKRYIFASTPSGVQRFDRIYKKWVNLGLSNVEAVSVSPSGDLYAAVHPKDLYLSKDLGNTWELLPQEPDINVRYSFKAMEDSILIDGVYPSYRISTNYGNSWIRLNYNPSNPWDCSIYFRNNKIFLHTTSKIILTTTFGLTTQEIIIPKSVYGKNSIVQNSLDEVFFCTGDSGIYKGINNFSFWQKVYSNTTLSITLKDDIIYSGTRKGVIQSTNNGLSWEFIFIEDTTRCFAQDLKVVDNKLYIASNAYGLFELDLPVGVNETTEIPKSFLLGQNYPNPFNPSTKISWQSPVSGHTTLKVYDVMGREVATLVDEFRQSGSYEIEFPNVETGHAPSLPSGVYFYRLQVGDYIETKKMMLLK